MVKRIKRFVNSPNNSVPIPYYGVSLQVVVKLGLECAVGAYDQPVNPLYYISIGMMNYRWAFLNYSKGRKMSLGCSIDPQGYDSSVSQLK